jgi:hypothetical protein
MKSFWPADWGSTSSFYLRPQHSQSRIRQTDRAAIIRARWGQGIFKQRVMEIERRCRITGVDNPIHLVASHCRPWRDSINEERLNGENGLLLTPSIDHLFDRGFIGFMDSSTQPCTQRRIVVWANTIPRSLMISTRSRELSL